RPAKQPTEPATIPSLVPNQKKRTIPNHLVPKKKPSFHLGTNNNNSKNKKSNALHPSLISDDQFNLLSFGTNNRKTITGPLLDKNTSVVVYLTYNLTTQLWDLTKIDDTFDGSIDNIDTDVPPKKSMFDLGTESSKPCLLTRNLTHLFTKTQNRSLISLTERDKDSAKINHLKNYNLAIIVFGYPESLSLEIIKFFESFGKILENFDDGSKNVNSTLLNLSTSQSSTNGKIIPIFSGKHWIKLTYDNPNSALQALQENGNVFNGSIIGVVPYHKSIIEKLEKKQIFANDDIGDGDLDIPLDKINEIINKQSKIVNNQEIGQPNGDAAPATGTSYTNRLDIKPADDHFFLKSDQTGDKSKTSKTDEAKNKEKLGVLGTISKYVFGFHDL
ncbi:Nucleoporin ASM4, partial [Candida viswanathii]